MNRRTFLKSVGVAVAVVSVPVVSAIAKSKPKWIRFSEATPKVGQKVIIVSQVSLLGSICGGVVTELPDRPHVINSVALSTTYDFYVCYTGGYPIGIFYSEEGKDVLSTRDWIREREFIIPRDYTEYRHDASFCHVGYDKDTYFWLAVDGDYPETIPPIPRNSVYDRLEGIKPQELNTACANFGIRRMISTYKF